MKIVHIRKYDDLIPVQLREDWEPHLESLAQTHGESSIVLEDGRTLHELRQPERDRAEREAAEAAEAERQRIEAEEAANNPPASESSPPEGEAKSGSQETPPASNDEQKPEVPAEAPAAKKTKKAGGAA